MMIVAGTGHRPPKLGIGYTEKDAVLLKDFAIQCLVKNTLPKEVISGMAQGWDQALAEAALSLGLPLIAAVPFVGMEDKWPKDGKERFYGIIKRATWVYNVCDPPYAAFKFIKRDHWMVDHATDVMALLDPQESKSGTGQTVAYALQQGKPVHNVWADWLVYKKSH